MSTVHVVPLHDLIDHTVPGGMPTAPHPETATWTGFEVVGDGESCVCGPRTEYVPSEDDGLDGWLVVHHSLDGRKWDGE